MISLAEVFPKSIQQSFIKKHLKAGAVIKTFCKFTTPPKYKYLMIASVEPNLLVFVINSKINEFISQNPDLLADQVDVPQRDHTFLEYDSILNCIEAHRVFNLSDLESDFIEHFSELYQGHLQDYCLRNVLDVVDNSVNLSPIIKREIIHSIKMSNNLAD